MNDVLPKPFTKEGLLQMLEKHLGHLKKQPHAMDHMGAPPPPLVQVAAKNSMKSEDSPVTSPATTSNWNSPGNNLGVSPAASNVTADEYMSAMNAQQRGGAGPGAYPLHPGMPPQMAYGASSQGAMGRPLQPGPQTPIALGGHRRGISEISGGPGDMSNDMKRQQMYAQGPPGIPQGLAPPHMAAPHPMHQPMGQPLQNPMNSIQRRSG